MNSRSPKQISPFIRRLAFHGVLGAILGVLLLHPLVTAVFFLEFKSQFDIPSESIWDFAITRLQTNAWFELNSHERHFCVDWCLIRHRGQHLLSRTRNTA